MKYYLFTVQYNKEVKAENRPQPKMFKDFMEAQAEFYAQVAKDMKNATLGGSINMIVDENGNTYYDLTKKWGVMDEESDAAEHTYDPGINNEELVE